MVFAVVCHEPDRIGSCAKVFCAKILSGEVTSGVRFAASWGGLR